MKDLHLIDSLPQAHELLKPLRINIIKLLAEPNTCTEIGEKLGLTPQKVNYHIKVLMKAGYVEQIRERQVRGTVEKTYQASARSYWLAPGLVSELGGKQRSRSKISFDYLVHLSLNFQDHLAKLSHRDESPSTVGLEANIYLRDQKERQAFLRDVNLAVRRLAEKYGKRNDVPDLADDLDRDFRVVLACYPDPDIESKRSV
jgi:DNA-binding transcriptional ArsR family regulator